MRAACCRPATLQRHHLLLLSMLAVQSTLGSDTARLVRISCTDGAVLEEIAHNDKCDVSEVLKSGGKPFAVGFRCARQLCWLSVHLPVCTPRPGCC